MNISLVYKKTIYISLFFLILPYLFRILNLDYQIISLFQTHLELSDGNEVKNKNSFQIILGYVEFYPYTYTNDKQIADGLFIDKMNRILEEYKRTYNPNIQFTYQSLPAKRLFEGLKTGNIHLFIGIKTIPELQPYTEAGKNVFGKIELRAYFLNSRTFKKGDFNDLDLLKNNTIILISGYGYSGLADKIKKNSNIKYIEAFDHQTAFEMLLLKRGDVLLEYKEPAEDIINKYKYGNLNYIELMTLDCYIIITKQMKNYKDLLEKLDKMYTKTQL